MMEADEFKTPRWLAAVQAELLEQAAQNTLEGHANPTPQEQEREGLHEDLRADKGRRLIERRAAWGV